MPADPAKARRRRRLPGLSEAPVGNVGEPHAFPGRPRLQRIDQITASLTEPSSRISEAMAAFGEHLKPLDGIPGTGPGAAEAGIAETGGDMSRLPAAAHLASWAGVCPGSNESAGRDRPGRTRHGNRWRTGALGAAAMAAAGTEDSTFSGARYRRLSGRLGRLEAVVATEHTIITAVWQVLSASTGCHDRGGEHHIRRDPERAQRRAIRALDRLGYTVTLDPIETTA